MIRTIIIEDELHCSDRLSRLLKELLPQTILYIDNFQTIEEGLNAIHQLQPDLVFLDVQVQEKTGFDLLLQLKEINFDIIFTTAYEKYAVQAFKFSAIDYLLKPIDPDDLVQSVHKVMEKIAVKENSLKIDALLQNLKYIRNESKRICVPVMNGLEFIQVSDIIRCESDINYTTIFIKGKPKLVVAKTLKEFGELLHDYNFFRVHNSHLINLAHIKSYNKGKGGYVTMHDNSVIEVSTRRKDDFLKKISGL